MIGLLVAGLFLMGLLVVPVLFAVLLFQAAVVDATPETSPTGQPGRLSVPGAVAGEGDALARGPPPGAEDLLAGTLPVMTGEKVINPEIRVEKFEVRVEGDDILVSKEAVQSAGAWRGAVPVPQPPGGA